MTKPREVFLLLNVLLVVYLMIGAIVPVVEERRTLELTFLA